MGADIYLKSKFDVQQKKWKPLFDSAVARRDAFPRGSAQAEEVQKEVTTAYDAMYAEGYFRDSYNNSLFLSKIGLSWWQDVVPMLDENGYMPIEKAKKFRAQVASTPLIEAEIATIYPDDPRETVREFFETKRKRLVALLDESIALNEPLRMSL